ncbi:MAG: AtpZ/AtpI family protein [Magnetococcales bacterium]|nr:AtpZ/AtpI family protein [Magnetococcales bacterium]
MSLGPSGKGSVEGRKEESADRPPAGPSGLSLAMRLSTEMVVATLIGVGIGQWLDGWLHTGPWATVIFFFFGVAAGFRNLYRIASS